MYETTIFLPCGGLWLAVWFAVRTGVPILPVYIPSKKPWFRPTTVVIGTPFMPEVESRKGTSEEFRAIAADLMERIRALGEGVQ